MKTLGATELPASPPATRDADEHLNPVDRQKLMQQGNPSGGTYRKEETGMKSGSRTAVLFVLTGLMLLALCAPTLSVAEEKSEKNLYERLGGLINIAPVVDDFLETLYVDNVLNANPKIKAARDRVPISYLKYQVTSLVCQSAGGPEKYTGRSMKAAHKHLDITEKEWKAMLDDFQRVLDKFKVPGREQKELFAIVESTKKDIVISTTGMKGH